MEISQASEITSPGRRVRAFLFDGKVDTIKGHAARLGKSPSSIYSQISNIGGVKANAVALTPRSLIERTVSCSRCGQSFVTKGRKTRFCSQKCFPRKRGGRKYQCATCGGPALVQRKYCSASCRPKKVKPPSKRPIKPQKPKVPCELCQKPFTQVLKSKRFCSEKCRSKSAEKRCKLSKPKWDPNTYEPSECSFCNGPMPIPRYFSLRYCSQECDKKAANKRGWKYQKDNPHLRIRSRLSSRLKECMLKAGKQKANSILKYLGCTPKELRDHLSSQFQTGMTWDNYGVFGWHIDHIIPCASFDLTKEEHIHVCFHYTNLQPLWQMDNSLKQDNHTINIPDTLKEKAFTVGVLVL
jgi:hypothetical protein